MRMAGRDDDRVVSRLGRQAGGFAAVEGDAVEVALADAVAGGGEEDSAARFIEIDHAGDNPIAAGEGANGRACGIVEVDVAEAGTLAGPDDGVVFEEASVAVKVEPRFAVLFDEER